MIRAVVVALALATPAAAQSTGLPSPMTPCGESHFDADRYRADLEARGWAFVPPLNRAAQIEALAQAFAALSVPADTPEEAVLGTARALWAARGEEAMMFSGTGQTLMLSGVAGDETTGRSILCYLALPGRGDLDAAFETALAREGHAPTTGAYEYFSTTYADIRPGQTLRVTFVRPAPGQPSGATAGFATRLDFPVGADQ
ncbi:MAG: hypothetical protein WBA67_16175 [Jannaschia sp.]